jgi:hypothetical protein
MDKYRGITKIPIIESKVNHLLGRLSSNRSIGSYATQEELLRAYSDIGNLILAGASKRLYGLPRVVKGTPINEDDFNLYLLGVYSEIVYLLDAVRNTGSMAEENFNFAVALIRRLQAGLKHSRQQLSSYILYTTQTADLFHFGETFSDEINIDTGSELLDQDECFIDLKEGTISLPRLPETDEWQIKGIDVGGYSNGVLGNNIEQKVPVRGSIKSMFDNNVDTWTEYERVVNIEDAEGLTFELKIKLEDLQVVNNIAIHPVFLGARTPFSIEAIEVSEDGRQWNSLKGDVRVADFLDEDPEERYHLAPDSSRFTGEFNITFAPRFVKFIRLLLKQTSAFPITDVNNNRRIRYAIAIKEIKIFGRKYASLGELVSTPINFTKNIAALGILSLVDPPEIPTDIGHAEYFISYDDGSSWSQISPLKDEALNIPEVLFPPSDTTTIRYKLRLEKDELAFGQFAQEESELPFTERFDWAKKRPFNLDLFNIPIEESITVCDPEVGTRGRIHPRIPLGNGVSSSLVTESDDTYRRHGETQLRLKVPLENIIDPATLFIYVNNTRWTKVKSTDNFTTQWDKRYVIERDTNNDSWEIVFGNDSATGPKGAIPAPSDEVSLYLTEEDCTVEGLVAPYVLKLDYTCDGEKANTDIRYYGGTYRYKITEKLPSGSNKVQLTNKNILVEDEYKEVVRSVQIVIRDSTGYLGVANSSNSDIPTFGTIREFKTFVNGDSELTSLGDWTIDKNEGIAYFRDKTPISDRVTINYYWQDTIRLNPSDWDFVRGKLDQIQIYESGYYTKDLSFALSSLASAGDSSVSITSQGEEIKGVVTKSLAIQGGQLNGYTAFEIPFIDGKSEFRGQTKLIDEEVPQSTSGADSIANFRVEHWETIVTTSSPFVNDDSETYFLVEKANSGSLSTQGDYFYSISGSDKGTIYVHMGGVGVSLPAGLTVSYQYIDEYSEERMKGSYSVNSIEGNIHFAEALTATDLTNTITLKYTPYRIKYNISKELEKETDYEYNADTNQILVLSAAQGAKEGLIAVNYKYLPNETSVLDLAPYFSPLVRALDIKVS